MKTRKMLCLWVKKNQFNYVFWKQIWIRIKLVYIGIFSMFRKKSILENRAQDIIFVMQYNAFNFILRFYTVSCPTVSCINALYLWSSLRVSFIRVLDRRVTVEPLKGPRYFIQKSSSRIFDSQDYRAVEVYCKSMMDGLFVFYFSHWQSTPARGGKWTDGYKHEQT